MNTEPDKMKFLTILLLLSSLFLSSLSSKASDLQNLLSFKASLPNPNPPQLHNWQKKAHPCSFYGVSCNNNSRVGSLHLTSLSLSADFTSVAAHLFPLEQLTSLHLKSANLSGSIGLEPGPFCSTSLAEIDLSENLISGPFSDVSNFRVCSGLKRLNLSSNLLDVSRGLTGSEKFGLSVETLDVSSNKLLSGDEVLPWILSGGCPNLGYLSLKGNKLTGSFSLSGCTHLSYLDISANNFSIPIPNLGSDCPNLQHLDLSSNRFSGQIGEAFLGLKMLKYLNMSNNLLAGGFDLPSLPSLEFLYLGNNHLQGVVPEGFADEACSTLLEIDLSFNNFSGMIPTGFGTCSLLETFDISSNNFTGDLPMGVFLKMGKLRKLGLGFNHFVGVLTDSVSTMTDLEVLDLSSNGVSGEIPDKICGSNLKELYLQNNLLTGLIPPSLGNCSKLVSLDLSFNQLSGMIPSSLGNLSNLKDLIMWMNQLEGDIPSELMYNRKLETLILDYNKLTGTIPSGLSNCTNLNWISLSSNKLSGEIPSWIGSLANLAILKLSNNSFHGKIPMELGDCKSLLWLDLNSNLLSGNIPSSLSKQSGFMVVGLVVGKKFVYLRNDGSKDCRGTGNLLEFAGIRQEALDRIPTGNTCNFTRIYMGNTQPTFNHNGSMIFLDLSFNNLEGSIPKELGSMGYLSILNLGHNVLSGSIPQELGGLKYIGVLDLSHNHLSGQIPPSLAGLTLLTEIDLSFNELTGVIPESGQFETFPAYRFYNNSGLCGYPLPNCDKNSTSNASHRQSDKRRASLVGSVAMGLLFSLFCIFSLFIVYTEVKKRKKLKESSLDIYTNDGNSQSATHTAWRFTSHQEALSINLSTFVNPLRRLTFADLLEATNGFNDDSIIGKGGFGDVYKARLKDGTFVAIKKLIHIGQGDREFTAEMETIGKIKHRNLVPLLGYCKVGEERLLVYEYMKHGSLDDVLHSQKKAGIKLNWSARRNIAMGAARGLAFLHHSCIPHIIHRDMKSSNVLVDENLEARVSDFGMARLMSAMDTHLSVSTLAGTPGYVPPEYYQSFQCSTKGDVYSYGVVLLELLTGKQPTDSIDFGDNNNLVSWVKLHAKLKVTDVFDKELMKEDSNLVVELLEHLKVACACLDDRPWKRPTMIQVMAMFKEIQAGSELENSGSTTIGDERRFSSTIDIIDHMSLTEIPEGNHKL